MNTIYIVGGAAIDITGKPDSICRERDSNLGRVGIRVSPYGVFNEMTPDADMDNLFRRLADELGRIGLAYIHVVDHSAMGAPAVTDAIKQDLREPLVYTAILALLFLARIVAWLRPDWLAALRGRKSASIPASS